VAISCSQGIFAQVIRTELADIREWEAFELIEEKVGEKSV